MEVVARLGQKVVWFESAKVSNRIKNVRDLEVYKLAMLNNMEMKAKTFCLPPAYPRTFSPSEDKS